MACHKLYFPLADLHRCADRAAVLLPRIFGGWHEGQHSGLRADDWKARQHRIAEGFLPGLYFRIPVYAAAFIALKKFDWHIRKVKSKSPRKMAQVVILRI